MEIVRRINLLMGTALIAALLGLFIATVHIDIHARQRYLVQSISFYWILLIWWFLDSVFPDCFSEGAAGGTLSVQRRQSSGFSERKKVKTRVVEADVGKEYHKFVNATIEYIYQYFQDGVSWLHGFFTTTTIFYDYCVLMIFSICAVGCSSFVDTSQQW